jgi:hypothetical protein
MAFDLIYVAIGDDDKKLVKKFVKEYKCCMRDVPGMNLIEGIKMLTLLRKN